MARRLDDINEVRHLVLRMPLQDARVSAYIVLGQIQRAEHERRAKYLVPVSHKIVALERPQKLRRGIERDDLAVVHHTFFGEKEFATKFHNGHALNCSEGLRA